ncbi:MAG: aldehyde dehydrogenase family protein, partial [Gammaproteobacteria bacterium]|nr:aldehyde dehydrogenase family protein [Gammaproteobacteria bacterium]
ALAAGRCVVCVTSPQAPMTGLLLAECYDALPAGVVNVLAGAAELTTALSARLGGRTGGAELSGRGARGAVPAIVLSDADLDLAVPGVAWLALRNAGQTYGARAQLYVDRAIAPAFADRLHEYMAFLEVGDPLKPDTDLGPLHSHEAVRRAEEQVARASKDGARIKLGGRAFRPWGLPGHFFQPTILFDVKRDSFAAREEILAPVVSIMPVDGLDDALDRTRALTCVGAEIHTRDATLAAQALRSIRLAESLSGAPASRPALVHVMARQSAWFPYSARERRAG